jgi:hypothetical protein
MSNEVTSATARADLSGHEVAVNGAVRWWR